jgi:kinetochore protein NDC80
MVDIQRKDLNPASNKDFQDIFKFLYSKIDSNFVFKRRFEEEVPNLLTQLMYPNANNINKSHLSTVGTQHKWPTLLGVLHWLMKLAQAEESIDEAQEGENTVNYDDPAFNDIAYCQYAQHRFSSTLQGVSDSEALENAEQVLHNLLDQKFDIYDHENQQLDAEIEDISNQLEKEKEKPNLKGCLDQLNIEKERAEQFLSYLQKNNEYKQRYLEDENNRNLEYEKLESEIGELKEVVVSLEETIDNQELTQAEIHHLINERINLLTELEQIKMKYRASESELEQLEEERRIRANDVLVELNRYNQLLEDCGLVDDNHERIQVILDPLAEQRTAMLNYELVSSVEPNLINLTNTFEQTQISTKTQTVKLQTDIQSIQVELEELEFQKDQCKVEVNQKDEEFREEKFKFESQSKALQDQINLIHMKIKKYNPKTKSDVLNAKGELNRIKTE